MRINARIATYRTIATKRPVRVMTFVCSCGMAHATVLDATEVPDQGLCHRCDTTSNLTVTELPPVNDEGAPVSRSLKVTIADSEALLTEYILDPEHNMEKALTVRNTLRSLLKLWEGSR